MFVSVIMPAYNAERFIGEAIESVLQQTHQHFELIIVNDGSQDHTLDIANRYAELDERIQILTQENRGVSVARNRAIEASRSNWIALMDADDVMEPNRLERQIAFVQQHPNLAVTSCCVTYIDDQGKSLGRNRPRLTTDEEVQESRKRDVVIGFHHTMVCKDAVLAIGGFRQEFWPAEDTDLWTRLADAGERILVQPEFLMQYRVHDQSTAVRQARPVQQYLNWVKQCSLNRRQGLPEPSFDEFMNERRGRPLLKRLNEERKDLAIVLFKQARFAYSTRRRLRTAVLIIASSVLNPLHAPIKVWKQIRGHGVAE